MCLNNFRHGLSIALMAQTFEGFNDLGTKAHDMESTSTSMKRTLKRVQSREWSRKTRTKKKSFYSCNVIVVDMDFQEQRVQIRQD